jgi:glycosyltransferase involved in cell wall biosynthesis
MKKICVISPSLSQGGLENAVTVVANEMAKTGNEVSIICVYKNPVFYTLDKRINIILPSYKREKFSTFHYYLKSIKYIRKNIKNIQPDIIISFGDFLNPISLIATYNLKIPVFISDRSSPGKKFPFLVQKMREKLYPQATGIIAQTERAKKQKEKMLKGKNSNIIIIPNALRTIKLYEDIKKENIVLAVARHYYVKGLDRLLEAFALTKREGWKLVIAGDYGPETEKLKTQAKELEIEKYIEFLGAVKEIDKVYAQAKILVLPSRSEGFPNALIEAMAHGLACISFDINAGPSDIIKNNENGILVPDGDIDELAKQIDFFMYNESERKRIGNNAVQIKNELSVSKIVNRIYNFITQNKV